MRKANLDDLRIDRARPRNRNVGIWIVVLALLAVLIGASWWFSRPAPLQVRTAAVAPTSPVATATVLNASGYVNARRKATVSSKVTGKVVEVLVEEGLEVDEGQVLARLDTSNVRAELNLAEAELEAARSALAETRVRISEAELELRRVSNLVDDGIVSRSEVDAAQAQVDSLKARLERQEDEMEVAGRRVALSQQLIEDTIIRAPFAGKVVSKDAQPGEMISPVSAGGGFTRTGICTLVDMDSLEIEIDVNESYINRVASGQRVEATLDAYPDWKIPARVLAIIPTADRDKATVQVRVGFESLDPRILPDMGVKVAFLESRPAAKSEPAPALVIPPEALRTAGGQDAVFVVNGGRVERRAVNVASRGREGARVISGLSAGERVVVEGPGDLADGDRVEEVAR